MCLGVLKYRILLYLPQILHNIEIGNTADQMQSYQHYIYLLKIIFMISVYNNNFIIILVIGFYYFCLLYRMI